MAISDAMNAAQAAAPTPAPASESAAPKGKGDGNDAAERFKKVGASIRAKMTEDQKAVEGSKRDKVEFVCALGNPANRQDRATEGTTVLSYKVVGYKFRLLEDMDVPRADIKPDWKTMLDVNPPTYEHHAAGDVVALNIVETGIFITQTEFAGQFTGGDTAVICTVKYSQDRGDAMPVLAKVGKGSVKEGMELIADMVGGDGKTLKGGAKPVVKPEFADKFGVLYRKRSLGSKGTGQAKVAGENQANLAAAFRAMYAKKFSQQQ